jgi:NADH-quinone oxidoreductase E subunit
LWLAQEQFGFLSNEVMDYVAGLLGMPPAHVYEAVTFYVMFKRKDMGKYCLQICNNITCSMMGSEKLIQVAKEELHINFNEVTEDKMFSLVPVQCLGSCDTAPVVQVNEEYCENLTPEKFKELLERLRSGKVSERPGLSCQ